MYRWRCGLAASRIRAVNRSSVEEILAAVSMPVQLGGGIRDMATIEMWLAKGLTRVILGTVAVKDPDLVRAACRACGPTAAAASAWRRRIPP